MAIFAASRLGALIQPPAAVGESWEEQQVVFLAERGHEDCDAGRLRVEMVRESPGAGVKDAHQPGLLAPGAQRYTRALEALEAVVTEAR